MLQEHFHEIERQTGYVAHWVREQQSRKEGEALDYTSLSRLFDAFCQTTRLTFFHPQADRRTQILYITVWAFMVSLPAPYVEGLVAAVLPEAVTMEGESITDAGSVENAPLRG